MKVNLQDLNEKIAQQDYLQDLATVKYADLGHYQAKIRPFATKMIEETGTALKHGSLSHIALEVTGQRPVTFALESNIINLPYSNYKKIANFFEEGKDYPVQVYFETQSDFLNASKFRIDQLATEEEITQDAAEVVERLTSAIAEKIKQVREYQKPAETVKKKLAQAAPAKAKKVRE